MMWLCPLFKQIISKAQAGELAPLHAVWGLGQISRTGHPEARKHLVQTLSHQVAELRANAARTCGTSR
jgi:hypothetical protein